MFVTKTRLVMGDLFLLAAVGFVLWAFFSSNKNLFAIELVTLVLAARSIFFHVSWYKSTRKLY